MKPLRVFGIDPGLTRCGMGVVDVFQNRRASLVKVQVLKTSPNDDLGVRLLSIGCSFENWLDLYSPDVVAIERVFSQHNVRTVISIAQISGVLIFEASRRGIPVALHTPTEVKAAVTGSGSSDKAAVTKMVTKILGLDVAPKLADASDALALALCHAWREGLQIQLIEDQKKKFVSDAGSGSRPISAREVWVEALRKNKGS